MPSLNNLENLKKELYVRPAWVMHGDGNMFFTEEEQEEIKRNKNAKHFFADDEAALALLDDAPIRPPSVEASESARDILARIEKDLALLKMKLK